MRDARAKARKDLLQVLPAAETDTESVQPPVKEDKNKPEPDAPNEEEERQLLVQEMMFTMSLIQQTGAQFAMMTCPWSDAAVVIHRSRFVERVVC